MATRRQSALGAMTNSGANSRASLGGAVRQVQKTPATKNTNNRKSILGGRASMSGRKSMLATKSPMVKARSSSIYSGRGSAAFMEGPKKDVRPIKEKAWQAEKSQELIEFLISANYNHNINPKIIMSPTRKDFECMFQFLYKLMDPSFEFSSKFEDDVIMIFKRLRYPFEVKKSALFAVGSPQYWPSLLAALSWIVELIKYDYESRNDEQVDFAGTDEIMSEDGEKLTYQYLTSAYRDFLAGNEEQSVESFFGPFYAEKERVLSVELTKLKQECGQFETRLAVLQDGESPLLQAQKRRDDFMADVEKFDQYITQLDERLTYFSKLETDLESDLASKDTELSGLEGDKKQLLDQITAQPVTIAEVQEMTIKRDALADQLRAAEMSMQKANEAIVEGESHASKSIEQIKSVAATFNVSASELNLGQHMKGVDFDLHVDAASKQTVNVDLKHTMMPALIELKNAYNKKVHELKEQLITVKDQAAQANDELAEKKGRLDMFNQEIRKIEVEVEEAQHHNDPELEGLVTERSNIEKDIEGAKRSHEEQVVELQQTVNAVKTEYEEKKAAFATQREQAKQQLAKTIEMVTQHKAYIHNNLMEVEMACTSVQAALQKAC